MPGNIPTDLWTGQATLGVCNSENFKSDIDKMGTIVEQKTELCEKQCMELETLRLKKRQREKIH